MSCILLIELNFRSKFMFVPHHSHVQSIGAPTFVLLLLYVSNLLTYILTDLDLNVVLGYCQR